MLRFMYGEWCPNMSKKTVQIYTIAPSVTTRKPPHQESLSWGLTHDTKPPPPPGGHVDMNKCLCVAEHTGDVRNSSSVW